MLLFNEPMSPRTIAEPSAVPALRSRLFIMAVPGESEREEDDRFVVAGFREEGFGADGFSAGRTLFCSRS